MKAIRINNFGGPEVFEFTEVPDPVAGFDEELISISSIGVNFGDTHQVDNSYISSQTLPLIPGMEVAGNLASGERVIAFLSSGGYAQKVCAKKTNIFKIPDGISDEIALTIFIQGITAWIAINKIGELTSGKTVLVHAAAGGVGSIAIQLAKSLGAYVIAAISNPEKAQLVKSLGADMVVDPHDSNLKNLLQLSNSGLGPDLILEMVGGKRFDISLEVLAPLGKLITYGMASRKAPSQILPTQLIGGSKTISGLWLVDYFQISGLIQDAFSELCNLVKFQKLRPILYKNFPLSLAAIAHEEILGRKSMGKITLDPKF